MIFSGYGSLRARHRVLDVVGARCGALGTASVYALRRPIGAGSSPCCARIYVRPTAGNDAPLV